VRGDKRAGWQECSGQSIEQMLSKREIVLKNTILTKGRCFYHHSAEKLTRAALAAGGMSVVNCRFHIAFQHHFFLLGKLIVQTEKMTCLMVRFHSYSLILFCFKDKPGVAGRNVTLRTAR
jgi:hypothetical protein